MPTGLISPLTKRRLRRGSFVGIVDLQAAINRYLAEHNADPKPFRWKADPDTIIPAAARHPGRGTSSGDIVPSFH